MIRIKKLLKTKIKEFNENGFIKIPRLISSDKAMELRDDLERFIEMNSKFLKSKEINYTNNRKINSIHNLTKWKQINIIQNDINLRNIVSNLLLNDISNFGAELFYKPKNNGIAVPLHQDNYYWCLKDPMAVTIWIALEKANKKNGGIFYLKKSHQLGLLEHEPSFTPGSSQRIKNPRGLESFKKVFPDLRPGDCLIHHSLIAHGSLTNKSNKSRVGITVRYKKKNVAKDKFLQKKYENELKKQIRLRNSNGI